MFNIQQFYVLPTQCIYVFCVYLQFSRNVICYRSIIVNTLHKRDTTTATTATTTTTNNNNYSYFHLGFSS
jgi:hypothetical protein